MQGRSQSQVTWAVAELSSPGKEAVNRAIGLTCVGRRGVRTCAGGGGAGEQPSSRTGERRREAHR